MRRRTFLRNCGAALGLAVLGGHGLPGALFAAEAYQPYSQPLPIPPLLDDLAPATELASFALTARRGRHRLINEFLTETMGYNGDYLGPTIRVRSGNQVRIKVDNGLDQPTTVHWHGLHVPAEYDGGPHQLIGAGDSWQPQFTIKQPAATLWYHPHAMGLTGEQVYRGLAGLFYIDDGVSETLDIPNTYGVDDFPLIIQDRRFFRDGSLAYVQSMMDVMHGVIGNIVLVNGREWPQLAVPAGMVRLRLLNGSNSSLYRISFGDNRQFFQIATDGGFLEQPVPLTESVLSPGERAEILIDFAGDAPGATPGLMVDQLPGGRHEAMRFAVGGPAARTFSLPDRLTAIDWLREKDAVNTRSMRLETFSADGPLAINGKRMDMGRIDERIRLGTTEIWEISNSSAGMMQMAHSLHLHDVQFQILDRNGVPPPPQERGRKDTVLVGPNETVRIIARFQDYTGVYMYHCHLLEHEDRGMMGQFEVVAGD